MPRGSSLFREGEPCRGLYLVLEGSVRVYRANRNGQEQVLQTVAAGGSLGEISLFDGGAYLASARVVENAHLLFLPFGEVQALYRTHPEVARAVVEDMGRRLRGMVALVDRLSLQDVPTRVAAAVLAYAEQAEGTVRDGLIFELPRTQEELADELGTTRESVARALGRLRRAGTVRQRGARIEILDAARLRGSTGRMAVRPGASWARRNR
jgi:CRP/FNR family transcriptional regulator